MNLYWPVYLKLEKEVLSIADSIHFSDDQLSVYSIQIADLIVRCAVEIEALSKELYKSLGGNMEPVDDAGNKRDLYFDTDCMALINSKWHLDKKSITIAAPTMYFEKENNRKLIPLAKSSKRGGAKWNKAYQALKHNRYENLKKATVENLLLSLGALYILNIYYKSDNFDLGRMGSGSIEFKNELGSSVFVAEFYQAHILEWHVGGWQIKPVPGDDLEASIYIIKLSDRDYNILDYNMQLDLRWSEKNFEASDRIRSFLQQHPEYKGKTIKEICYAAGGEHLHKEIVSDIFVKGGTPEPLLQAVLNKHIGDIYPGEQEYSNDDLDKELDRQWIQALVGQVRTKKLW